jgi:DNA-binding PadR family transcriptional regulator
MEAPAMFADNTLTPKEAVRLCALGTIATRPMRYSELAGSVRHFTSRIMGPSLELMGTSIELLRYEGLVEAIGGTGMEDDAVLEITRAGRRELNSLLTARLRPGSDLSKLVVALKIRFLDLLDLPERRRQVDLLIEGVESELSRLIDLRGAHADVDWADSALVGWLDHDISLLESRQTWLEEFLARL